jgi:hypothetical protein
LSEEIIKLNRIAFESKGNRRKIGLPGQTVEQLKEQMAAEKIVCKT